MRILKPTPYQDPPKVLPACPHFVRGFSRRLKSLYCLVTEAYALLRGSYLNRLLQGAISLNCLLQGADFGTDREVHTTERHFETNSEVLTSRL
jgi:hypothetical protein|uniref:Uncharacterized protein n=1 Tax=Picea glauca TaxID=3330 RepID=A0A117NI83_PICGL|nr:hypothetical protein ABT39_MTgene2761 [Picea glauca]QHR89667.1 hypothetical protein Q903MT_gene3689 [Picea sitchensis]